MEKESVVCAHQNGLLRLNISGKCMKGNVKYDEMKSEMVYNNLNNAWICQVK